MRRDTATFARFSFTSLNIKVLRSLKDIPRIPSLSGIVLHRQICGDITVAHTAREISEFSVTSFYEVGLELGLIEKHDIVSYIAEDELDFEKIDKR